MSKEIKHSGKHDQHHSARHKANSLLRQVKMYPGHYLIILEQCITEEIFTHQECSILSAQRHTNCRIQPVATSNIDHAPIWK
jgi:hypothetical protein